MAKGETASPEASECWYPNESLCDSSTPTPSSLGSHLYRTHIKYISWSEKASPSEGTNQDGLTRIRFIFLHSNVRNATTKSNSGATNQNALRRQISSPPSESQRETLNYHRDTCRRLHNHALNKFEQIPKSNTRPASAPSPWPTTHPQRLVERAIRSPRCSNTTAARGHALCWERASGHDQRVRLLWR